MPTTMTGIANVSAMRPLPPLSRVALAIAMAVVTWEQRRQTRVAISHLDGHLLRDIGLTPDQAVHEARKPFWMG